MFFAYPLNIYSFDIFYLDDTSPSEIYTLSLHDALPILVATDFSHDAEIAIELIRGLFLPAGSHVRLVNVRARDRKSTRLNSSHLGISYAVFCLKKKKMLTAPPQRHRSSPCES